MTTAFVLSGGGSLGSIQVGMLVALAERGVVPDFLVGTSVGAINAAWIAGRPGLDGARKLAEVWRSVRRDDVFPARPLTGLLGLLGRNDYLVPSSSLRSLLERNLNYLRLEDAPIPVQVVTTELTTGLEVVLASGDAVDAVAASAAIPAVFPPVEVDGRHLVDGGVANNTPISHAIDAGASTIYVLPTGYACSLERPPRGALAVALQALTLLVHQRLTADIARFQESTDLRVLPPLCPLGVSPIDFSHTGELVERARDAAAKWLDGPRRRADQSALLSLHRHSHDAMSGGPASLAKLGRRNPEM